ncbi:MAG: NUDIX domain-containing protein [Balneolaceae bacterium]
MTASDAPFPESRWSDALRVRACAVVIENESVLMVRQISPALNRSVWLLPGGAIEMGESAVEALRREVREETGLVVEPGAFQFVHEFLYPPLHAVELVFEAELTGGELISGFDPELPEDEQLILETDFLPIGTLDRFEIWPDFLSSRIANWGAGPSHYRTDRF